jgi:hypothetical protein
MTAVDICRRGSVRNDHAQPRYLLAEVGVGYRMVDGDDAP